MNKLESEIENHRMRAIMCENIGNTNEAKDEWYMYDCLSALKNIQDSGDCNVCASQKGCQYAPTLGQTVRYNCPFYKKMKTSEILEQIQSSGVCPRQGEWISCSERLPKRDEFVLISYRGEVHFCKYLDDGSENAWWSYIHDCCVWNEDVIAWMPLPEPYKKESDKNDK